MQISFDSVSVLCVFFCKQKTAYEMRISDWSSDVCSSDRADLLDQGPKHPERAVRAAFLLQQLQADLPFVLHAEMLAGQLIHAPLERLAEPEIAIGRASCRESVCQYV